MRKDQDHDKQIAQEAIEAIELREKEVGDRLKALIAQKRSEAIEGEHPRTRGHATRVLRPRMGDLREMMVLGMSIMEMVNTLSEAGVMVSYQSLRTFLIKHMPSDYREFVAIGSGKAMPTELSQPEKESVERFLSGAGNRKEEATPTQTPNEPAATGESDQLSDLIGQAVKPRKFDI